MHTSADKFARILADPDHMRYFATWVRSSPKLRYITYCHTYNGAAEESGPSFPQLDRLQTRRKPTCTIRSIQRLGRELIHASFELYDKRYSGIDIQDHFDGNEYYPVHFTFHEDDDQSCSPYTEYIDFEGMPVPFHILERMKEVQGEGMDWDHRGVEVKETAWDVLLQWKAGVIAS